MAGVLQPMLVEQAEVQIEEEGIALALAMCAPGGCVELHAAWCDMTECSCVPRVIRKPDPKG